ncbi:metallophosphoesterase family protein [Mucilaginibacter polytrichastri]|uniref:Calcineurin-like phosphoesterase domain-containing protein n=1 Tax=Mucilaginibacter polytrichastri TaxID=1302689 RepID=A0A1Q5ZYZ1_9SPHI|nr:metallophosphoesterase [Mucilaginibacter polytrichastri]OKS86994.1 hypothetical protein RG47T_2452 [Mucilaginibacter polytrichastri]SFS85614.1 Calcineurin-like phosphoesterase [Mucilaginibacter polytrichastri]
MNYTVPVLKKNQPDDSYKFQPLPNPTGKYPYHLPLNEVLPGINPKRMCFHMAGDTGGNRQPEARKSIVEQMAAQAVEGSFLYHLGDLVYHHGEADQFAQQFFEPFEQYPGPIFAIAGNHDSDINPDSKQPYQSLDAFTAVFCGNVPQRISFSGKSKRQNMIQPNVYWTLETPLATIIGLHTNVPKYGVVLAEQLNWFKEELLAAPKDKMLIICLHHAPYSADINHGSSLLMIEMLENAYAATGVRPDVVFSGHVHNYQRFHKTDKDGTETPYVVAGAGGFDELHNIALLSDERFAGLPVNGVTLKHANGTQHGFLKITIEQSKSNLVLTGKYYAMSGHVAIENDCFTVCKPIHKN